MQKNLRILCCILSTFEVNLVHHHHLDNEENVEVLAHRWKEGKRFGNLYAILV
jgi:hypothetical protein